MGVTLREAAERDIQAVTDIYNYEVVHGWATFDIEPRTVDERLSWLGDLRYPYCLIVAEEGGTVIGWGALRAFHERAAYRFTAQDSVFIHSGHRGRGVGRLVLGRLVELARERGFHTVLAGIAQDNPASERLHASLGFRPVGTQREVGYKFGRWLDVTWYQLMV
jgi:phosphinothricin acetyltransferase